MGAHEAIIGELDWCNPNAALAVVTPLDRLFAEYRRERAEVERIASFAKQATGAMSYFIDGARVEHHGHYLSASSLFELGPALRALDSSYWSKAMALTDVLELMPAKTKNEWNQQIRSNTTPPFEVESARATLQDMLAKRSQFFAERVDGLFKTLSPDHVTNLCWGFTQRMIISGLRDSFGSICSRRVNYVADLRCIIAKFMGRTEPASGLSRRDLSAINDEQRFGEWHSYDGNAFRLRLYKKGTAHIEIHPDLAYKMNQVLAWLHPAAIPTEFRTKPPKAPKTHELRHDLISFEVLARFDEATIHSEKRRMCFYSATNGKLPDDAQQVLRYIGGTPNKFGDWDFDYDPAPVIAQIIRTGMIPEQKSHQYYATPKVVGDFAVDLADIQPEDDCLEPSGGQGELADLMPKTQTVCIEISPLHHAILVAKGYQAICADFLQWQPGKRFQKIIMNPPFSDGRAVDHVKHAVTLLADNGVLVAILPGSLKGKTLVEGFQHEWVRSFSNEFANTSVTVSVLRLTPQ